MTSMLLNSPYWLIALLGVLAVVLMLTGLRRNQPNLRIGAMAVIALAALLLVLRFTVDTDEKRIERDTRAMIAAIARNDWNAAAPYLKHAQLMTFQGDELVSHAKERAGSYGLTDVKVNSIDLKPEPNVYVVTLSVTSYHKGQMMDSIPSTWSLEYQKRSQNWVLTNLVPIRIGFGDTVRPEDIIGGRR
jgi:hypothetical protein